MNSMVEVGQITAGIDVYGADGTKVGTIVAIQTDYVVVETDRFVASDHSRPVAPATDCSIPIGAIVSVVEGKAFLNAATDRVLNQGWVAEPMVEDVAGSTGFSDTPSGAVADVGFTGAAVPDDDLDFAPWSREHATTSVDDLDMDVDVAADGTRPIPFDQAGLTATMREGDIAEDWRATDVVDERRTPEMPVAEERAPAEWWPPAQPVAASGADAFLSEDSVESPTWNEEMAALAQVGVAAEAEVGTEPVRWIEWGTDTARRQGSRIDEDVTVATTRDANHDLGAGRQDGDSVLDDATDLERAGKDASGMRGDTLVGTIERQYDVDFGVRSDMHLSTLLARRGAASLSELLHGAKATAAGGDR